MIKRISFFDKPLVGANVWDYAKLANETAKRSEKYALEIVSYGVRGNVDPKQVYKYLEGDVAIFDRKTGKMTELGKKEITDEIKSLFRLKSDKTAQNVTIGQYMRGLVAEYADRFPRLTHR